MAKIPASAKGANRKRATPLRKNIGRKTMQMHSVETNAGVAICAAPSRMPSCKSAPSSKKQQDHQTGKRGCERRFSDNAADSPSHEDRLIRKRLDLQLRWKRLNHARRRLTNTFRSIYC